MGLLINGGLSHTVPNIRTALGQHLLTGLGHKACLHTCLSSVYIGPRPTQQTQDVESSVVYCGLGLKKIIVCLR